MPLNYRYWLGLEYLTMTQAVFLLCGEQPRDESEGERRTPEHHAAEAWTRKHVTVVQVEAPKTVSVLAGSNQPRRMTPGVRTKALLKTLLAQKPIVWGQGLIDAHARQDRAPAAVNPIKPARIKNKLPARKEAMWRLIREVPRDQRRAWREIDYYHELQIRELELFDMTPESFHAHVWSRMGDELKEAIETA